MPETGTDVLIRARVEDAGWPQWRPLRRSSATGMEARPELVPRYAQSEPERALRPARTSLRIRRRDRAESGADEIADLDASWTRRQISLLLDQEPSLGLVIPHPVSHAKAIRDYLDVSLQHLMNVGILEPRAHLTGGRCAALVLAEWPLARNNGAKRRARGEAALEALPVALRDRVQESAAEGDIWINSDHVLSLAMNAPRFNEVRSGAGPRVRSPPGVIRWYTPEGLATHPTRTHYGPNFRKPGLYLQSRQTGERRNS